MHGKAHLEPARHSVVQDVSSCHYITRAEVCLLSYNVHAVRQPKNRMSIFT